ncbi:MAG TPA: hypothetical protein VGJ15_04460 [Pirellulales bacterium]
MARPFRIFTKKRGHRRTGSPTLGSAGEALFFAILFITGLAFLVLLLARMVIPEWRANHEFIQTTATVMKARVGESTDSDGKPVYRPEALLHYQADGQDYDSWTFDITGGYSSNQEEVQAIVDRITPDREYWCWYDPLNPAKAVLVRGYRWWFWLLLLLPIGFLSSGGGGLIYVIWHWGKSTEHRAARGQPGRIDLFDTTQPTVKNYPTVPHDADLTNSPGTQLKYRLPANTSQGWRLLGATVACLLWNGIVAGFFVVAVRKHFQGNGDWQLDLFVLPFLLAGGFLVYYFIRELLIATGIGPTLIEISDHPLWPGKTYALHLVQGGSLTMNSLEVLLQCEEVATYRQGTDSRTDRRVVHRQNVFHRNQFEIAPGQNFEALFDLHVPPLAMHSFKSDHNEVQWKLVVRGNVEGWPPFERSFPVVVYPPTPTHFEPVAGPPIQPVELSVP